MDFNYNKYSIKSFFNSKKKYIVPRYQREYSWGDYELKEFYNDIISNIKINNNELISTEYFFGNLLFVGDLAGTSKTVDIIDGQQRITTFTIFLSVLSKMFYEIGETKMGDILWENIMAKDDDANEYAVLVNDTPNPYFQYLIQTKNSTSMNKLNPSTEEEDNIYRAYQYFYNQLSKNTLIKTFKNRSIENFEYIDLLKAVRNQLIGSFVICIWTTEVSHANIIFETLNAKGKELASIDLIKNCIFENLSTTEPTDDALNKWKQIIKNLNSSNLRISMSTFYRHYWISKYSKCTESKLYDKFLKEKSLKKKEDYEKFLIDLVDNSELYIRIICPKIEHYDNRKEKQYIVQSLKNINNVFNVTQTRVILMAILTLYNNGFLSDKQLSNVLNYIENFHFAYTGLCALRPNTLEGIYSKYAIQLRTCKNKAEANSVIEELKTKLDVLFPKYNDFKINFMSKLKYSKKPIPSNVLTKYVVNKIENSCSNRDYDHDDGSIEHIISESPNEITLSIGNLILLEQSINNNIPDGISINDKISNYYKESNYKHMKYFCEQYNSFSEQYITSRAEKLAAYYYSKIINKDIN